MHEAIVRLVVSLLVATGVWTLTGCASQPEVSPDALIGKSVGDADDLVPTGRSYAWYDLSQQVLHKPGTLIGGDHPYGEGGVIIAVCADASTIEKSTKIAAGAIPLKDFTGAVKQHAEAGDYQTLLPECASE